LYKSKNLSVQLVPYDNDNNPDLVDDLISGKYHFVVLQADTLLKARSEGKPIVGVFVTYRKSPLIYISKKEKNIKTPLDFKGKKIGVAYSEKIPLISLLKNANISESEVKIIDREYSYEPLLQGTYDIEAGWVTDLDTVESLGMNQPNIVYAGDYGGNLFGDIIVTTDKTIETEPDLVARFVKATQEGWVEVSKNIYQNAQLTLQYDPKADPKHLNHVLSVSMPLIKPSESTVPGISTYVEWRRMYELLKEQKVIEKDFDLTTAYNLRFTQ
jgi:NitT/TauT family transport system substrate-binding protein